MSSATAPTETTRDRGVVAHPAELIALRHAARGLELRPPQRARSALAGPYLSAVRGRGLDFEEVRAYQPGDDVRNIDWRVTARTGRVHSKVFHEERERPIWIGLDAGPSMRFGTRVAFKTVAAARAAALLAWSAQRAGDRVGAFVSSPDRLSVQPPAARENHLMRVLAEISRATRDSGPALATRMSDCLGRMREQVRPGSRVYLLSDFYGFDESWQRALADLSRRNHVSCVLVFDTLEAQAPAAGRYRVSDGHDVRSISASGKWRRAFAQDFEARRDGLAEFCRSHLIDLLSLRTDEDPVEALAGSLDHRQRGRT